ncbi:hypothetical protein KJS94_02735 [Flavihumibacter rivuli]|uniref:STM3941 family protein n=1 Tax=Flavihumibacter rivuli TaxID=2838156 RepID=UPI001BDE291E|nr:STM3941 family protein [Flavihumibacter rivuli]ULQ57112.1 hypothetical protein KJS94_02735 [Flavihumibacter rivuli]
MNEQVEIPLNKKKMLPLLLGALAFSLTGIWMINLALRVKNQLISQVIFFVIGLSALLFFGLVALVMLMKIFSNKAGMTITDEGMIDNASGISVGFIGWNEIKKIQYTQNGNFTTLVVFVKKPEKYLERESNFLKRLAMRMNHKISGSPIHITASFLDINLYTLNEMIATKRFQQKTKNGLD